MRKLALALLVCLLLAPAARAQTPEPAELFGAQALEEALDGQTRQALSGLTPTSGGDFGAQLLRILSDALSSSGGAVRDALGAAAKLLAAALVCAFAACAEQSGQSALAARLAGAFAITALCTQDVTSMLALAEQTVQRIADFTALLLPVLSASLAAGGAAISAGALLAGASFAMSLLTALCSRVLIPLVYVYVLLACAESAGEAQLVQKLRALAGRGMELLIKGVCAAFTAYLSLSRVLNGASDTAAVKAAQAAISGMVPVVGSILSDASSSLLASAGMIRSTAGLFGMLALLAMAVTPFLRLGAFYLALKFAGALSAGAALPAHTGLLERLSAAMGYMLAITAGALWMALCAAACFLKAVGG